MDKMIHLIDDWGYIEVDESGKLIDSSLDFCENFSINKLDCLGDSIHKSSTERMAETEKSLFRGDLRDQLYY